MKTLAVLSGGGAAGIDIHCGILKAMKEALIVPDHYSGASAGACASAWSASHNYDTVKMEEFVRTLNNSLLAYRNLWYLREAWLDSMMSNVPIYNALKANLPVDIPSNVSLWATKCRNRERVNVADYTLAGDLPTAVLASMSIRGIWPTVRLKDGDDYADGGFRFDLPYDKTLFPGYDVIYLLVACGKPSQYISGQKGLITILRQDIDWLIESSVLATIENSINDYRVKLIWPFVDNPGMSFDHSLINKAYEETKRQLKYFAATTTPDNVLRCKKAIVSEYQNLKNA